VTSSVDHTDTLAAPTSGATDSPCELSILMPCLDEAETVEVCIRKARSYLASAGIDGEVVIADNGSTDGSQDLARAAGARVIDVPTRGYGAALIAGINGARGTYIIMGDADDSYDFSNLDAFVTALRDGAELVMGNRFKGGIAPGAMPALHRYLGNPVLSFIGRLFFKSPIRDFHCGLRGFRRTSALALDLRTTGMEFASEFVVKATLAEQTIVEVPTTLSKDGRTRPPHLRSWRDGWRHLRFLLLYSPRWLFLYPGYLAMAIGIAGLIALGSGIWTPGQGQFAEGLLIASGGFLIAGFQAVLFAFLAREFAATERLLPPSRSRIRHRISFESGLVVGVLLFLAGIVGLIASLSVSAGTTPVPASTSAAFRLGACAVVVTVLGIQVALGSSFLSLLDLRRLDSSAPTA
jgi:glycosyltransferase involved in cell wall biosynthesis